MPNNQIINTQAQIENAREFVRASRVKIADFESQLQQLQPATGGAGGQGQGGGSQGQGQQQKDALLRQWDDEMDLLDNYLLNLEGAMTGFTGLQEIQNYAQLQSQFSSLKNTIRSINADLKIANEALAKIEKTERRAILELNDSAYQAFVADITIKMQESAQKISDLQSADPVDNDALNAEMEIRSALQNKKQAKQQEQNAKLQLIVNIGVDKTNKISEIGGFSQSLGSNTQALEMNLLEISMLNDPRYLVDTFNDDTPFLLLPVRVETRYMDIKHVRRTIEGDTGGGFSIPDKKELWVRVFPDDIAIHTHEKRLAADEENAGHVYWIAYWGLEIPEEGIDPQLGAWRVLSGAYGAERAAWIAKQTEPTNLTEDPLPAVPAFPVLEIKNSAWTEAAKSYVLPDRFVVRLYKDESNYREIVGSHIPDPLQVGMDPSDESEESFDQHEGEVQFPEEIKWLRDFKEAKNVGMGISIALEPEEEVHIHRILVLGLKLGADKTEATKLFEELVENHHYTTGGFSLIPQGTPTNNTEGLKSGYEKIKSDAKESLHVEGKGPLFSTETGLLDKSDGQWFADLMGLDQEMLQNVFHANGTDICEAIAMNRALWPATMGYYIKQMLHPHISTAERNRTRDFFNQYVLGRGKIPAFRVDNQPYGVITSTAFSRWEYGDNPGQKEAFYERLNHNLFRPMSMIWGGLANTDVSRVDIHSISGDPSYDPSKEFLDIMGLHASSVEFHQRFANGAHKMWNLYRFIRDSNPDVGPVDLPADFKIMDHVLVGDHVIRYNSELGMLLIEPAKIFELNFLEDQRLLNGPVIDGFKAFPYSEERGIQSFPDTGWNYIHWLIDPTTSMSRIKAENFDNIPGAALDQKPPKALLYLLLRHAYLQEYLNTSTSLAVAAGKASSEAELEIELQGIVAATGLSEEEKAIVLKAVTEEVTLTTTLQIKQQVEVEFQTMQNVARHQIRTREGELLGQAQNTIQQTITSEFNNRIGQYKADTVKWDYLTKPIGAISGALTMEAHIDGLLLGSHGTVESLNYLKDSLEKLEGLPTARLERAFAEHLDLCNYRLDAWMTGMVSERLESQQSADKGIYLGAFAILENLKPNTSNPGIHVVEVDGSMAELDTSPAVTEAFTYLGIGDPAIILERDTDNGKVRVVPQIDDQNQGYIHTPSVNHAVTAAILRAGYMSHQLTLSDDNAMAVNLTSQRIRRAMFYLEGLQNGQSLAAMLGYRFERELHDIANLFVDDSDVPQLDQYILDFRLAYPLTVGGVLPKEDIPVENQEARNVLDGLALLNTYEQDEIEFNSVLSEITVITEEKDAILLVVDQIQNDMDAIADLLLSESVYQLAKGNIERSGAVMKILGEGGYVQEPEIIKTPRQGAALTHRFGIQFDPSTDSATIWTVEGTARSFSEPGLNDWLSKQMPLPSSIVFNVEYDTVAIDVEGEEIITVNPLQLNLDDLNIEPIDFIYLMGDQGGSQDATELSTRIAYYIIENEIEEDGLKIRISYTDTVGLATHELSLFQILPLVKELKSIIGNSRTLNHEDFLLAADAQIQTTPDLVAYLSSNGTSDRLKKVTGLTAGFDNDMISLIANIEDYLTTVDGLIYPLDPADPVDPANEAPLADLRNEILKGAFYGISNIYPSAVFDFSEVEKDNLVSIGNRLKGVLSDRLEKATTLLGGLGTLGSIKAINDNVNKAGQAIFGRPFRVFPNFELTNSEEVGYARDAHNLLDEVGDMAVEEWSQSIAKVKPNMSNYQKMRLYSDSLTGSQSSELMVTQLPLLPLEDGEDTDAALARMRWVGMTLPADYDMPGDNLSLVLELPEGIDLEGNHCGMVLDEWVETIPYPNVHTGVAVHYNEPNAEAANSLIMAVTPKVTGHWRWDDLMDTLNETLSLAKKRAVEPDHLKEKIWGQTLPALLAAISPNDSTPSLDFARNIVDANNGQYGFIAPADYAVE
ncbi:MAG: hypothetical protein GQ574_01135 [Crocinitomix sp.]|nr:hypothetical protein [Crocinitomix sp.]